MPKASFDAMTHKDQVFSRLVLALRARETNNWVLETTISSFEEVHQILSQRIRDNAEVRLVGRLIHSPGALLREREVERCAFECGWHRSGEFWVPIEQPLPLQPPLHLETTKVAFTIKELLFGSIAVEVMAGTQRLEFVFDDVYDKPVVFVRFIQILAAGGLPHAAMADSTWCDFIVDDGPVPDLCRLIVDNDAPDRKHRIDVYTNRTALIEAFRGLAREIGEHPNFAHHFLYHMCLPDEHYERVGNAHDQDWADGVQRGIYPDDYDAENALLGTRIVEQVPLLPECAEEAVKYRKMMRSLEIPRDWQIEFGLQSIATDEDAGYIRSLFASK
ncbi:MAG: hypothetical protein JSR61_00710 [Proteobacteria bacterium]|nr:hypothetical protein [Pseudomonadota bacterium]